MSQQRLLVLLGVVLAAVLFSAGAPTGAFAQNNPFAPPTIPEPAPTQTPQPTQPKTKKPADVSEKTLLFAGAALILLFGGIGFLIVRDSRRSLSEDERRKLQVRGVEHGRGSADLASKAKKKARAKARAARAARKRGR